MQKILVSQEKHCLKKKKIGITAFYDQWPLEKLNLAIKLSRSLESFLPEHIYIDKQAKKKSNVIKSAHINTSFELLIHLHILKSSFCLQFILSFLLPLISLACSIVNHKCLQYTSYNFTD